MGGDRARRGADIREREGERMEGGIPFVLDKVLEAMVLESVHLLVLGRGRSLLGRERKCSTISILGNIALHNTVLMCVYQNNTVYTSDNNTVNTHLMERDGCRGRCHHHHQCTVQLRTCYSHQVLVSLASQ